MGKRNRSADGAAQARPASTAGWTLLELLIVLALISTLSALAIPELSEAVERAKVAHAIGDVRAIQSEIQALPADSLPATLSEIGWGRALDPWGNPYRYLRLDKNNKGQARKDRFLVPLNSTYDLYSMGRDGASQPPITAKLSRDDVIRANDGGYIGLASRY